MELTESEKMIIAMADFNQMNVYKCNIHGIFSKAKIVDDNRCVTCGANTQNITNEVSPFQSAFRDEFGDGPWN